LRLQLSEGKKRQIRRMMAAVGHRVRRLVRLTIGSAALGDLKQGQWRYLTDEEVRNLTQTSIDRNSGERRGARKPERAR
jgi:16S rRNA U516 pseudouridylate synthase RsuA-like enzyme